MGKSVHADVLDAALALLRSNASTIVALAGQPANFAAAQIGALASAAITPADFTPGAVSGGGRRLTVAAKAGLAVAASGTADHVALLDMATSRLLFVTDCAPVALLAGGTLDLAGWSIDLGMAA